MLRSTLVLAAALALPVGLAAASPQAQKQAPPAHNHAHGDSHDHGAAGDPLAAATRMSAADAKKAVDAGKAVILDVRAAQAYQAGHIAGSINIPLNELAARHKELPRDKQVIAYCT